MKSRNQTIFELLVMVPILLFLGFSIYLKTQVSKPVIIATLIIFFLLIIHHLLRFWRMYQNVKHGGTFHKSFGLFFILLATFLLIFNIYILNQNGDKNGLKNKNK